MKHPINFFAAFIIFTTVFSLSPLCLNINAQTSANKKQVQEEKQEVQKFVDSFVQSLEEIKDLDQVPKTFFVTNFKTRFAKNDELRKPENKELYAQFTDAERYEDNVVSFNFFYLTFLHKAGTGTIVTSKAEDDDSEIDNREETFFSPEAIAIMKKSKTLNSFFDPNYEFKSVGELHNLTADRRKVADAERTYLNQAHSPRRGKLLTLNLEKTSKKNRNSINITAKYVKGTTAKTYRKELVLSKSHRIRLY